MEPRRPAPADATTRRLLLAAWVLSGLTVAAANWRAFLPGASDAVARVLTAVAGLAWAALPLAAGWRVFVLETTAALCERLGIVAPVLIALGATLLAGAATRPSTTVLVVAVASWSLATAGAVEAWRTDRRRLGGVTALLAVNLLLLFALDMGIRFLVLPYHTHNSLYVQHDPEIGWRLRASAARTRRTAHYVSHETVSAHGFRTAERPFHKPPGAQRVVVLGDSHSEGYTVDDDQVWPVVLERALSGETRVEVVNLGVGGYSTDQEYLAYLLWGRRYEPDLVVLQFCSNDFVDNGTANYWRGYKPVFRRFGETLVLAQNPVPDFRDSGVVPSTLVERSGIGTLLEILLRNLRWKWAGTWQPADREEAWRVTALLLRDLRDAVRADGAELVVFAADPDVAGLDRRLQRMLASLGIPYVDIRPVYTAGAAAVRVPGDTHWNAAGHRAVGQLLAEAVRPRLGRRSQSK